MIFYIKQSKRLHMCEDVINDHYKINKKKKKAQ